MRIIKYALLTFFLGVLIGFLIGCAEDDLVYDSETCSVYYDLCFDGTNKRYEVCVDDYSLWYKVGDKIYYTSDYMLLKECGF